MPRIEELQFVHWGSLRPDPVPLLTDGVNVATGPNGSGKTCFLDGIKLLLGVTELAPGRTSARYIFDGGPGGAPAEQAFIRGTFANPVLVDTGERLFAAAGGGCETAGRVSVVCLVQPESRRYLIRPGQVRWGLERSLADDLRLFLHDNPPERWLGPRRYDDLLSRTGITKALRGVLALPQGAIDRMTEERAPGMLRKLLELTGEQAVVEELRVARERFEGARAAYLAAMEQLSTEQNRLATLQDLAGRHREWAVLRERLEVLEEVGLPAAAFRDALARVEAAREARDSQARVVAEDQAAVATLVDQAPRLEAELEQLADQADQVEAQLSEAAEAARSLDGRVASLQLRLAEAEGALARAQGLAGQRAGEQAGGEAGRAEAALQDALARRRELSARLTQLQAEAAVLREGRPYPPQEVEEFRAKLAAQGIESMLVAEALDLPAEGADETARTRVEAALGDAVWGLVVASDTYREATALAVESGYRWGIVRAGAGEPTGALAQVFGPVELGLLLERVDAWATIDTNQAHGLAARGHAAVAPDGMRYADAISRLQAPERPILGRVARERRLAHVRAEAHRCDEELAELDERIPELRADWHRAVQVLDAIRSLPEAVKARDEARRALREAQAVGEPVAERPSRIARQLRTLDQRCGEVAASLDMARERQAQAEARLARSRPRLTELEEDLAAFQAELGSHTLTPEQRAVLEGGDLPGTESVRRDMEWLAEQVADNERFGADVRDESVLTKRVAQARSVEEAERNAAERKQDADVLEGRVEDVRRHYEERVRHVVRRLSAEFARICQTAGAEGELRLITGERPEEFGVDVLVAHRAGERKRSYRDASHSGGQRAKIAILLLLATMGRGAADLLLMDEHIAHLDSTNIDHVAELMHTLVDRVQFILATPTNAEALRLSWCDLQLAFLPRDPGQPFSPPIRLLSRLGVGDVEARIPTAGAALASELSFS